MKNSSLTILLLLLSARFLHAQNPTANFRSSDTTICANDCITFTNLSANSTSCQWFFPGGSPASSTSQTAAFVCYLTSGNYDVTLVAINGVNRDTVTISKFITVNQSPAVPIITQAGNILYASYDSSYTAYQ